jgi:alpha-1,6-mannosyltransferase
VNEEVSSGSGVRWPSRAWIMAGLVLVGLNLILLGLSPHLRYGTQPGSLVYIVLVSVEVLASAVYLLRVCRSQGSSAPSVLVWILLVGLAMRVIMLFSTPILEDDFYRYLWDGAVVARGYNPYTYAPQAFLGQPGATDSPPEALRELAVASGEIVGRINFPHLTTIYPPLAQGAFALAHWLAPWNLTAWRLVLLMGDAAALFLLVLILRTLNLPLSSLAIYWWNPLLIIEVYNACHLDVLLLPFVLGSILLTLSGWMIAALLALAGAIGVKIWPLILLPLVIRPLAGHPWRLGVGVSVFALVLGLIFFPMYPAAGGVHSGLLAYGSRWEMNDALFKLITWGASALLQGMGLPAEAGPQLARWLVLALLAALLLWLARKPLRDGLDLCQRCLWVLAALFLLSPAQFPWYYVGLIPFLAVRPRLSLLLLTALLPLYYLRDLFLARGQAEIFDYGIVWLEFVPVWTLLAWEWWSNRETKGEKLTL